MVGRLVQYQQVARFEHHAGHGQTCPLAARKHLDFLVDILAAEQERPEDIAQAGTDVPHRHAVERIVHREFAVHQVVLVLGIVADIDVGTEPHRTFGRRQLPDEHPRQRGLAFAVTADKGDLVALPDDEIRAAEDMLRPERHPGFVDLGHDLSRAGCGRELDIERRQVFLLDLEPFEAFELLDARLHLIRLGRFVTELLDEFLGLFDHALLVFIGSHLLRPAFGAQHDVFRIGNLVIGRFAQREFDRAIGDVVEESSVVRDQQHGAAVILQVILEPLDRLDVEMVRRLVEQEDRGTAQQQFRQLDTHAPAAREFARRASEIPAFEPEPQQRLFDIRFAGLAAEDMVVILRIVQAVQQLRITVAFVVGTLRDLARQVLDLGLEAQHLLERLGGLLDERRRIGHTHGLRQVADRTVAVQGHAARGRLLLARNDAQQRGFARPVPADEADAVFGVYQERYVVEERPAPVTYSKIVKRYHGLSKITAKLVI